MQLDACLYTCSCTCACSSHVLLYVQGELVLGDTVVPMYVDQSRDALDGEKTVRGRKGTREGEGEEESHLTLAESWHSTLRTL